ncbi:transcriptional repressor NrdR [Ehrlichia ruminantium]|uniref:Transcriptional repressor NrdR n=1 Tax=Ehrlichia ruminantium TaxID=779 RepID=A0AAE6Q9S8_EHRRU|nr:transcriptional regulator NrdR [Ehrlichia ruminantium]QGR02213.1 transcriptional repressor NrdR [Ehrlichia ruminantium]QGR03135.1 transcriptional repressor NrdR [Ehrlichia ruminantium]QGR04060.1 transcriptional repressor NrdR [Ehrlichia ruminantium]
MKCPFCNNISTHVKDSRSIENGMLIRRRRVCPVCNSRFTTTEKLLLRSLVVIKKNGESEPFDKKKLLSSILIATKKRPVNHERINMMVNNIFYELEGKQDNAIPSDVIGKMVMDNLFKLDKVAYVRFASVYMNFKNINDFSNIIAKIINENHL